MINIKEKVLKEIGEDFIVVGRAVDLTLTERNKEVGKVIDKWLGDYCSHGKDNCLECIKELKQKLGIK